MKKNWKVIAVSAGGVLVLAVLVVLALNRSGAPSESDALVDVPQEDTTVLLYGIDVGKYDLAENTVEFGETIGQIFGRYGVGPGLVDQIARKSEPVFSLRGIKAGQKYTTFQTKDSAARLAYFVYEASMTDYLVFDLSGDSVRVYMDTKNVTVKRRMKTATITSSLWNCMIDNGMSPMLAMDLSDIYAWSIDFFGIQEGDNFTVIYDQKYVDTVEIGHGTIWGARFEHGGKNYYAIPFMQDGKVSYWDEQGQSLRKNLLKAPLKYSRISSRFSASRLHPILRIRRPHYGVDYAAPSGTPVVAVGDGVVIAKGYGGGGGNTLKIKHNSGQLVSGYLHLKGYAKGINKGTRVRQGQLIGYVGATGLANGPHLDFRLWRNGTPIDPLKVPTEPAEPVRAANKQAFDGVRDRIMAELNGTLADSLKVTSFAPAADTSRAANPDSVKQTPAR